MPAAKPDIMPTQHAPPTGSEQHAPRRPYRGGRSAAGEVLATLPRHPLAASLFQLAIDLDLPPYTIERAIQGIVAGGVGIVRTFGRVSIAPGSWQTAQQQAEAYWHDTYEHF